MEIQVAIIPKPYNRYCSKLLPKQFGQRLLWQEPPTNLEKEIIPAKQEQVFEQNTDK